MIEHVMTNRELELLIQLLDTEAQRLPQEIHHTDAWEFKKELQKRLQTIERLTERFRQRLAELRPRAEVAEPAGRGDRAQIKNR